MSKLLAESLYEFRKENSEEEVNEAKGLFGDLAAQGKQFRKMFPEAGAALIKKGKKDNVATLVKWLKKLKELGFPSDKDLKAKIGDKSFQSLQNTVKYMNNQLASFAATPGGASAGRSGGVEGSTEDHIKAIAAEVGMEAQELADLLKK